MSETTPATAKSTVLLKHHLKSLRLPTMERECEKIASRTANENLDHLTFLLQLVELEMVDREHRAADRRLKAAKFPYHKSLDEFDFEVQPSLNKQLLLELMRGDYLDGRENILLVGNSGTGKTHVATSLGIAACGQGKKVRFFRVTELITLLLEAREERQLLGLRTQLAKQDLLILDELGYVPGSNGRLVRDARKPMLGDRNEFRVNELMTDVIRREAESLLNDEGKWWEAVSNWEAESDSVK